MRAAHRSSSRDGVRNVARRRTISAAVIERVVRAVRHRAVPGRAVDAQPAPGDALLGDVHGDVARAVVAHRRVATGLGQHVLRADGVPVVVDHVLGAPVPAGLLVGDAEVDQRALRPEALVGQLAERDGHRRRDAQHVDGAAAPHLAVDQLAAERVAGPAVGVHRHDVGVAHQAQRRGVGIAALDARDDRRAPGPAVVAGDVEAGPLEVRLQEVGVADLVAGVRGPVVDALVADEGLQQLGRRPGGRLGGDHGAEPTARERSQSARSRPITIVSWYSPSQRRASRSTPSRRNPTRS